MQAIRSTRPGGHVGFVGVSHDVSSSGDDLFYSGVHIHGGPAPVRRFLPELIQLIWDPRSIRARSSTSHCRLTKPPKATRRWTSAGPSKWSCNPEPSNLPTEGRNP